MILQDSANIRWKVTATSAGLLVTTVTTQSPVETVYLNYGTTSSWQVLVVQNPANSSEWVLDTTQVTFSRTYPNLLPLYTPANNIFYLVVLSNGRLQTTPGWMPNGLGAGADNSVAGGLGGYMSLPQPPSPSGGFNVPVEWYGQFAPVSQTYFIGGNFYTLTNPGRSA